MQISPPDILITNYKMLDLLLQQAQDAPLSANTTSGTWSWTSSTPTTVRAGPAAAHVRIEDPAAAIALVKAAHTEPYGHGGGLPVIEQDDARYLGFLRTSLERLRTRGAIGHKWLERYLSEAGTSRYFIWGKRPPGMRAFPKGIAAPVFLLSAPKTKSEFDFATGRLSWYERSGHSARSGCHESRPRSFGRGSCPRWSKRACSRCALRPTAACASTV
ncbi:hypothetical protein SMICM17S_13160 [Streptomyces microflavus]